MHGILNMEHFRCIKHLNSNYLEHCVIGVHTKWIYMISRSLSFCLLLSLYQSSGLFLSTARLRKQKASKCTTSAGNLLPFDPLTCQPYHMIHVWNTNSGGSKGHCIRSVRSIVYTGSVCPTIREISSLLSWTINTVNASVKRQGIRWCLNSALLGCPYKTSCVL